MKEILVETSARHVHLSQADLEVLFGKDAKLTHKKVNTSFKNKPLSEAPKAIHTSKAASGSLINVIIQSEIPSNKINNEDRLPIAAPTINRHRFGF